MGDEFGPADFGEAVRAVHAAIDLGINFFDVAPYYGRTLAEERLGVALKGRRDNVILATKCGRYDVAGFDFSAGRVRASIEESLRRLRTDYVDVFQAHDIEFGSEAQIVNETVPAMRELQVQGKVRFIGITGLQLKMLRRVADEAPVDTILSYCRYDLLNTDLDRWLTPFVDEQGIGLINASPLHMGMLTAKGPPSWHPANEAVRLAAREMAGNCEHISEIALRFSLDHPYAATTLSGMSTVDEVERNVKAAATPVDPDLMATLRRIAAPYENMIWPTGLAENYDYAASH